MLYEKYIYIEETITYTLMFSPSLVVNAFEQLIYKLEANFTFKRINVLSLHHISIGSSGNSRRVYRD
jgi:hypothetical protein